MQASLNNSLRLRAYRRELRNHPTAAEALLWKNLQRRQILGKEFRRQFSIGRYIVDLFCAECKLAVELDGAVHCDVMRAEYDAERTAFLEGEGVQVIRFENKWVFENLDGVLETIREAIRSL